MSKRKVPETSKSAFYSLDPVELNEMYRGILSTLTLMNKGTFEEIAAYMKVDKSRVWKRLSELERMGFIYRPGTKKLLKSGRNGYEWALTTKGMPKTDKDIKILKGGTISDFSRRIKEISKEANQLKLL